MGGRDRRWGRINTGGRAAGAAWPPLAAMVAVLTLVCLLIGARVAVRHVSFVVGYDADRRILVNFNAIEQNGEGYFRWSQPSSQLFLYGFDGHAATLRLRLSAQRPPGAQPALVSLRQGADPLLQLSVAAPWRQYHLLVPTTAGGETMFGLVTPPFQPRGPGSRQVGVAISRGTADVADKGWVPAPERIVFLVALPLLALLLMMRLGSSIVPAAAVGAGLAALAGWAGARPMAVGYWLPTVGMPWWPGVPLMALIFLPQIRRSLGQFGYLVQHRLVFAPWVGGGVAALAVLGLRLGLNVAVGLTCLLLGSAVVGASVVAARRPGDGEPVITRRAELLCVLGLLIGACFLRTFRLDTLPLGLWRDEARHGLLALQIWHDPTFRPIYVVEGADLPALLFYLMAPIVGIFGPHLWSVRLVSALAGALAPMALWWTLRPRLGARIALYAAALLAWTSWSLSLSRWAFPVTLDQLFVLLAIGCVWRALPPVGESFGSVSPGRRAFQFLFMSAASLCAGLATYTYHTGRMAPVILAALTALQLGKDRSRWRQARGALIVAAVVGLLVVLPLVLFVLGDFQGWTRRTDQVAVVTSADSDTHAPLVLLLRNVQRYLLMWQVRGEPNGRHHAPSAPMLDPLAGVLLVIGLIAAVLHRRPVALGLMVWLGLGLVPGLLSTDAPHAMRSFGALAPACALVAIGLTAFCQAARRRGSRRPLSMLPYALGTASLLFNSWLYFGQMAHDPAVYGQFDVDTTAMARVVMAQTASHDHAVQAVHIFLPLDNGKEDVARFLLSGSTVGWINGTSLSTPPGSDAMVLLPIVSSPGRQQQAMASLGPHATPVAALPCYSGGAGPFFRAYTVGDVPARLLSLPTSAGGTLACTSNERTVAAPASEHRLYLPVLRR